MKQQHLLSEGFSAAVLKWVAILTMLIDHIGASILLQYIRMQNYPEHFLKLYHILRAIGRISFPLFIFLLVEGYRYTKNRKKYILRMLLFSFISEIPFDLAFHQLPFYWGAQNIYFTLTLGLLTICLLDWMDQKWKQNNIFDNSLKWYLKILVICFMCLLAALLHTDYDYSGILAITTMYLVRTEVSASILLRFRNNHLKLQKLPAILAMCLTCLVLLTSSLSEIYSLFSVPLLLIYNGRRGKQYKYFFYWFYPVHLLLLYVLMKLCGLT